MTDTLMTHREYENLSEELAGLPMRIASNP